MTRFGKILTLGVVTVILITAGFLVFGGGQQQNKNFDPENTVTVLDEDDRLPDDIKPIPINVQDIRAVDESMLPPEMTQEYMQKQRQSRAEKLLGTSLVEVSGAGTLAVPFTLGEEEELLSVSGYALNEWISPSKFIFTDYDDGPCGFPCEGEKFLYNINTKTKTPLAKDEEWSVSLDGKLAIKYEQGTMKEPTEALGVFYLKDMKTGEVRDLGRTVRSTGYDGSYTGSCLWAFEWSPNSQSVGMFDWCKYNDGPAVYVLPANANDISERRFLGFTKYRETERPKNEKLIFWSPDSAKIYTRDSYAVFDIASGKETFRP